MNSKLDRRKLLGIAIGATSSVAMADGLSLGGILISAEGESKVRAILAEYFQDAHGIEAVIGAFYRSLLAGKSHHEDREFFLEHLESKELETRLETYVIEEFVLSTNYLSVRDGHEAAMRMVYS